MIVKSIIRAFTSEGGSFLSVRDENGDVTVESVGATVIRLFLCLLFLGGLKFLGII